MPFPGIPAGSALERKIDRCVQDVMAQGRDKRAAIAICRESITNNKDRQDAIIEANYRDAGPASTQVCATCRFAEGETCSLFDFRFNPEWTCDRWLPDIERARARLTELQSMNSRQQYIDEAKERIRLKREISGATRRNLSDSDYVFPETRSFPIINTTDVKAAVNSWGRATAVRNRGFTFDDFKRRLTRIAKRKGLESALPGEWTQEKATLSVFKDATGKYRWLLVSSSAFEDQDKEIVSTKALENAIAEHDRTNERGPLRFWHVKGADIGQTDFGMLHGRMMLESGTFYDERIGEALAEKADKLGASIGFQHPLNEPVDGTYHNISIFERSILPKEKASNIFTSLTVHKENRMNEEKKAALKDLLQDDVLAEQVLSQIEQTDKAAKAQGFTYKSHDELSALSADEMLEYALERKEYEEAQAKQTQTNDGETLKAIQRVEQQFDRIIGLLEKHDTAIKELQQTAAETKESKVEKDKFSEVDKRLKQLEDEQPKALNRGNGYRASQDSQPVDEEPVTEEDGTAEAMKAVEENPQLAPFANVVKGMSPIHHPYWGGPMNATQPGQGG